MINVQKLIDEAVLKDNQSRAGKRDGAKFHVSDAGLCYRQRYLKRLGVTPSRVIDAKSLRKMRAGDAGHKELQGLLAGARKLFASESTVETEHIKGHFDGIVKEGAEKVLLEMKTNEKWAMGYIKSDGPKPQHLLQMFTYWFFARQDYTHLDQALLFYVKREDFEGVPFNFLWSEDIEKRVAAEWKPLIDYWIRQELPPCTCDQDYMNSSGVSNGPKYCRFPHFDEEGKQDGCCHESLLETVEKKEKVAV